MLRAIITLATGEKAGQAAWSELLFPFERKSPVGGRVEKVTAKQLSEIVANFDSAQPVPVGYNHAVMRGETDPDKTRAAGWIEKIELFSGRLRAWIRWTDDGAKRVKAEEFKFLSAEIVPDAEHPDPKEKRRIGSM